MTSQAALGTEDSEQNSISPFSSSSSGGDEESFKIKYIHEKERNRKLNERLAGYRTVVNQFSKEQEEKSKIQERLRALEKEVLEQRSKNTQPAQVTSPSKQDPAQGFEQVFTDLEHQPRSRNSSKWTSASSPSFIVIDQHGNERSLPNSRAHSPAVKPKGDKATSGELPAVKDNKSAFVAPPLTTETSNSAKTVHSEVPLYPQLLPSQKSVEPLLTKTQSPQTHQIKTATEPQSKNLNNLNCQSTSPEGSQISSSTLPTNIRSLPIQSPSEPFPRPLWSRSVSTSSGISITAWRGPPVKSQWQMEQEMLSRARSSDASPPSHGLPQTYQPPPSTHYTQSSTNGHESSTHSDPRFLHDPSQTQLANGVQQIPFQGQLINSNDLNLNHAEVNTSNIPTPGHNQPPTQSWGVGARPKSSNAIQDVSQVTPLFPQLNGGDVPQTRTFDPEETILQNQGQNSNIQEPPGSFVPLVLPSSNPDQGTIPATSFMSHSNSSRANLDPVEPWVTIGNEDLMKFPSLKSTPSPEDKAPTERVPQETSYFSEKQVLANPSDEQSQLASQAHSMAAVLKDGNQSGISDMLFKFAETASHMEQKLMEYQALIQRQQVQIQSLNKHSNENEMLQLRLENENLLAYINQLKSKNVPGMVQEPGWTTLEKPLNNSDLGGGAEKIKHLEGINSKLYQANKEWHSKWEALRQQTMDEKKKLETKLQTYMGDMEKLRRDVSKMEIQLSEAYAARQEANQKNLQLEQEKLNLLKKVEALKAQSENLPKENRRLMAEIQALKKQNQASESKLKGSEIMGKTNEQLRSEMAVLKQQLNVFHEDFTKEREDRTKAEAKAEKLRKEREAMKVELISKTKKSQAMVKTKDEDIKQKTRQLAELQYQVDDLTQQLQRERRQTHQSKSYPATVGTGSSNSILYTSMSTTPISVRVNPTLEAATNHTFPLTRQTGANIQHQPTSNLSPEHLPGAWQCHKCTYINFPERSICDICGWENVPGNSIAEGTDPTGRAELKSRGQLNNAATDVPDVVTDTEVEEVQAS